MEASVAGGLGTFAVAFPEISVDLDPSTKARPFDAVGVEVMIVQHLDCVQDIPGR